MSLALPGVSLFACKTFEVDNKCSESVYVEYAKQLLAEILTAPLVCFCCSIRQWCLVLVINHRQLRLQSELLVE